MAPHFAHHSESTMQMPAKKTAAAGSPTQQLCSFLSSIRYEDLPEPVVARTEELFLDWFASALAGKGARPVETLHAFATAMGPGEGRAEDLLSRKGTSPFFAALINGAASHFVEQDDLHNSSVLHPGTVVFPAVLAAAQAVGASGKDLIAASVAGYECGVRVGEFLGRSHYRIFHTTGTAGKLAAAAGVAAAAAGALAAPVLLQPGTTNHPAHGKSEQIQRSLGAETGLNQRSQLRRKFTDRHSPETMG
jgi:2-methylcitrate dehydratase PrpD